jgi:hypothetical protein
MYKRKMVLLGPKEVKLQAMTLWDTGLVGSKDEVKQVKAEAQEVAASTSKPGPKKKAVSKKKSPYKGEYRAMPIVPLPGHLAQAAVVATGPRPAALYEPVERTAENFALAKKEVEQRRAVVEQSLTEDAAYQKAQAMGRLEKTKAARLAKLQREHELRVANLNSEQVSPEEQEVPLHITYTHTHTHTHRNHHCHHTHHSVHVPTFTSGHKRDCEDT